MFKSKLKNDNLLNGGQTETLEEYDWNVVITRNMLKQYNIDITQILKNVDQWDYDGCSQMRNISIFLCHVCDMKIKNFKEWKDHIWSIKHLSHINKIVKMYSYVCVVCDTLMYGSLKKIRLHRINKHNDISDSPTVSQLMAIVIETPGTHWYFCTHCDIFSKSLTEIHPFDPKHYPNEILFYCKYCNITFLSSIEVLDYHSLSVEHVTLKCKYFLNIAINEEEKIKEKKSEKKGNRKKKKELKRHTEIQVAEITKLVPSIKLKLPLIILNRFQNISQEIAKCKLCYIVFDWSTENIIQHLLNVCKKPNGFPTDFINTCPTINTYDCQICKYKVYSFIVYLNHVISLKHLSNCLINESLYSYICSPCNLYMYSTKHKIADHCKDKHHVEPYDFCLRYKFLADNYKYISNLPECESVQLYYDLPEEKLEGNSLYSVQYQCDVCKIDFGDQLCDYTNHMISSEHIILKYITLNSISLNMEIHNDPSQLTPMMYKYSTVDMENLDHTGSQSLENIDDEENLQEVSKDPIKMEGNKNDESVFHSTILKNQEPFKNDSLNISHSELSHSSFSEISTVSGNENTYLDVLDSKFNSSAKVLKKYTQSSTKYLDVSTNAEHLKPQVLTFDKDEHNINQELPVEKIDIDVENNIDLTKTPINNISTTVLNKSLTNIIKLHGQQNPIDMDEEYGQYVAQRLKYIHDASTKIEIKLEIDFLFYNKIVCPTKDSVEN